jgi:regulator of nucleoside diphosphate kinase
MRGVTTTIELEIRTPDTSRSKYLDHHIERQLERDLKAFADRIDNVVVHLRDLNGPRAGIDKQCTMVASLAGLEVAARATSDDWYAAVTRAGTRLARGIGKALGRRRRSERTPIPQPPSRPSTERPSEPAREPPIMVTEADLARLMRVIANASARDASAAEALEGELDRAQVVPSESVPREAVTMNSSITFQDDETGKRRSITLVYPHDADPRHGRISVLAPIGSALLGLSIGQTIEWPLPNGNKKVLRVVGIDYQPEAARELPL